MKRASKILAFVLCVFTLVLMFAMPVSANQLFEDMTPEFWCYEKIVDFAKKGYVTGYEDKTFRPNRHITRAEYVKIVNNFFGYSADANAKSEFTDVADDAWYAPYVNEAVRRGYITGYEDGTFKPEDPIRRQEATVILSRILKIDKEEYPANHADGLAQYSDGDDVQEWARVAIHSYSVYNFINGYEDGSLRILQNVTRAETVELLNMLEQHIEIDRKERKTRVRKVEAPVITVYELVDGEDKVATTWVNRARAYQNDGENMKHAMVEITCPTEGAEIRYTVDGGEEQVYNGRFPVYEGRHEIEAYAIKTKMANSPKVNKTAKVDTVAPRVTGIIGDNKVKVLAEDFNKFDVNEISGLDKASVLVAWFTMEERRISDNINNDGMAINATYIIYNPYIRESGWLTPDENGEVAIPDVPGVYYLGARAKDIAGNKMIEWYNDDRVIDGDSVISGDEVGDATNEPWVIVNENEQLPEDLPSGDIVNPTPDPVVVKVDTSYTVEHYKENANDDEYTKVYSHEWNADVGEEVNPHIDPADDGFHINEEKSNRTGIATRDRSLVIKIYYDRNEYKVNYFVDEAIIDSGDYKFEQTVEKHDPATKEGYTFVEWSGEVATMPNHDVDVVAVFEANTDTKYVVNHLIETLSGDYELKDTDNMTGTTGEKTNAVAKSYTGFTAQDFEQKTIAANGSTVVEIKYTRNDYEVIYLVDGEEYERETYAFEEEVTMMDEPICEDGYHFSGWTPKEIGKMPADNVTVVGEKIANTDTKYQYEYLIEDLGTADAEGEYSIYESGEKTGTTDSEVTLDIIDIEGFTFNSGDERNNLKDTIAGDESTVLKAYYTRNRHTITYMLDGEQHEDIEEYQYGAPITMRDDPSVDEGHTFGGWAPELPATMPDEDLIVSGNITVNKYTLTYKLDGKVVSEEEYDYGTNVTKLPAPTKEGHTFSGWSGEVDVMPAHDVEVVGSFRINSYKITYYVDGKVSGEDVYEYDAKVTARPEPTKPGYTFKGWEPKVPAKMPANDVTVSGEFVANTDTKYKVIHGLQSLESSTHYVGAKTEYLTGVTGEMTKAEATTFEGYTAQPITQEPIKGDGSTIIWIKYNRNTYTVTYKVDGEVLGEVESYKFEQPVEMRAKPSKIGFDFIGWDPKTIGNMPAHPVEVNGRFTPSKNTQYKVEHYIETLSGDYELKDTDTKTGTTGEMTNAVAKSYTGFTAQDFEQKTIAANGSTVVEIYYDRNEYTLTYMNSGDVYAEDTYSYGANITARPGPEAPEGYEFRRWNPAVPTTMPAEDKIVNAEFNEVIPNIKITSFEVTNITTDTPKAEPGDTVNLELAIKSNQDADAKVVLDLTTDGTLGDTFVIVDSEGNQVGEPHGLTTPLELEIAGGHILRIRFSATVDSEHPVNENFVVDAEITTIKGTAIDDKKAKTPIEKSATIVGTNVTGKNVVLVLDLSGSMDECALHGEDVSKNNGKYGHNQTVGYDRWGRPIREFVECEKKIDALKRAAKDFIDQLEKDSNDADTDITLTLIGIGNNQGYDNSGMRNTDMGSQCYAYKMGFYAKAEFANAKTKINDLSANGGTNITGALKLVHTALQNNGGNGITFLNDANEYVVLLTDGANGSSGQTRIPNDNADAKYIRENATLFAIAFGTGATAGTNGYKDLKAITADENLIYSAASSESLQNAFATIATLISKEQSVGGEHALELPADGKYFPVIVSDKNGELFRVNTVAELATRNMTVADGKLTWDVSGTEFSACVDLKIKLTLKDGNDGMPMSLMMFMAAPVELSEDPVSGEETTEPTDLASGEEVAEVKEPASGEEVAEVKVPTSGEEKVEVKVPASGEEKVDVEEPTEETTEATETEEITEPEVKDEEPVIKPEDADESEEGEDDANDENENAGEDNTLIDEAIIPEDDEDDESEVDA